MIPPSNSISAPTSPFVLLAISSTSQSPVTLPSL
jgi:hypothetical protein